MWGLLLCENHRLKIILWLSVEKKSFVSI